MKRASWLSKKEFRSTSSSTSQWRRNYRTPEKSPRRLYQNVLVSIDARKGINNGSPSLWAFLFDQLDLKPGERVLQVGAGTGYYTAVLATLVRRRGRVDAIEFEKRLA